MDNSVAKVSLENSSVHNNFIKFKISDFFIVEQRKGINVGLNYTIYLLYNALCIVVKYIHGKQVIHLYINISGGPLSALTCCVNARLLSAIKKISPLIYSQSWVGSWVYTKQAMMSFTLIF